MQTLTHTRELKQIANLMNSRGIAAVIDGDAVAVLRPRTLQSAGLSHVRYEVERVWTLTQAYVTLN